MNNSRPPPPSLQRVSGCERSARRRHRSRKPSDRKARLPTSSHQIMPSHPNRHPHRLPGGGGAFILLIAQIPLSAPLRSPSSSWKIPLFTLRREFPAFPFSVLTLLSFRVRAFPARESALLISSVYLIFVATIAPFVLFEIAWYSTTRLVGAAPLLCVAACNGCVTLPS